MKQLVNMIVLLALTASVTKAQPVKVEPFADAVPYSIKTSSNVYFTNRNAETVKSFFENQQGLKPGRIITVDDGFYHGYRICYGSTDCENPENGSTWIQVLTIDTEECLAWYRKTNPEFLLIPFQAMKESGKKNKRMQSEFRNTFEKYQHLACRLYRLTEAQDGTERDEMAVVQESYNMKVSNNYDMMLASGDNGSSVINTDPDFNMQQIWDQYLKEIDLIGFTTLIEYNVDTTELPVFSDGN